MCTTTTHVASAVSVASFPIKRALSCSSTNVVYVVLCRRCMVQGVGETHCPTNRIHKYLQEIEEGLLLPDNACAISKHFCDGNHTLDDFEVTLVDQVQPLANFHPAVITPLCLRLAWLWIHRLQAPLNVRREWRNSFLLGRCLPTSVVSM